MDKFVIIDGNSLIYRAFYALPMLTNFDGEISNAVFGFTNILVKIINEIKPKYICVAFDYGKKNFRHELYKDYKGTRKETPRELKGQFPILKELLTKMNIKLIEKEGVEADDIIGTLTKMFDTENIVVTGDKDSFQLINKNTHVCFTKKGITETLDCNETTLMQEYGIMPYQVIEEKALMGDASDNIPGVAGVGEKTAKTLLANYKTLDGVYEHIDELKGKLKETLISNKETAYLSRTLATINTSVPLDVKLEDMVYEFPFNYATYEMFKRYQFNSLLKRKEIFQNFDDVNQDETMNLKDVDINTITTKEETIKFVNNILKSGNVYFVLNNNELVFYDLKTETKFNFNGDLIDKGIDIEETLNLLKPVFESENINKYVYDYKDLLHKLNKYNIKLNNVVFDAMVARYLINANSKSGATFVEVVNENLLAIKNLGYSLQLLVEIYKNKLKQLNLESLYENIEMPLIEVLFEMETNGFKIDKNELYALDTKYSEELNMLTNKIYEYAGGTFNINSPKQLGEVLFDKLKISVYNNKKNSTGIDVLNEIVNHHPIVPYIIRYRQISKLYTTYVKAFENLLDEETGKIYTLFNQTLTSTGRLSSSEPNLQNIPVRTDEGKALRKIFVPTQSDGYLVSADYSQIELRLLANFCGDEKLLSAFKNGEDIHTTTASEIFGVAKSDVTSAMRRDAKAINFGIIYGISDYGLSQNIGSTRKVAADYIKRYYEKYPKVKDYMDGNVAFARENGYVKTMFGRIRNILEIHSSNYNLRQFGERAAMNMPLQGSASDIIKLAMIKVDQQLKQENLKSKLILQIHDELIVDCVKGELNRVMEILKECMENVVELPVKLDVNVEYGSNWFESK